MKRRYKKMNGEVIELENEEFNNMPFNSKLKLIKEDKEKSQDLKDMSKDELLDYTAVKGIEADYKMTKKELIKIIQEKDGDE